MQYHFKSYPNPSQSFPPFPTFILPVLVNYLSCVEEGDRRLDVVEFVWYCQALQIEPLDGLAIILTKPLHKYQYSKQK